MGLVGLISARTKSGPRTPGLSGALTVSEYASGSRGLPELNKVLTGVNTFILIVSSFTMVLALDAVQRGNIGKLAMPRRDRARRRSSASRSTSTST
jgi:hypothetical protein